MATWNWQFDGWIILTGMLCAVAAALPGCFLVLRRMSMLGDAIAHAVLPGLAAAFLITESRSSPVMFAGAVVAGVVTALLTEWIRRFGRVDEGASMGVVFTSLFALGLVLIVWSADRVHLDADCVLYGALEFTPLDTVSIAGRQIPRAVPVLGTVLVINAAFIVLFFKELRISTFDPALAAALGFRPGLMHYLLMVLVAVTAVASFETAGSILVVAMFIVPAAAASLLTDRLSSMVAISALLAALSALLGHTAALELPRLLGFGSTTTAGMMAVCSGGLLFVCVLISPRHGLLTRLVRRRLLAWRILQDDIIAVLFRLQERGDHPETNLQTMQSILLVRPAGLKLALRLLQYRKLIRFSGDAVTLTAAGAAAGRQLVRAHRLWEQYLASHASVDAARLHDKAERFEHFTSRTLRDELDAATHAPRIDPHGTPIPDETPADAESG